MLRLCKGIVEAQKPVLLEQLRILSKATDLAAASDIWAYQGIRTMDQPRSVYDEDAYDPSPEAEARREAQRMKIDPEDLSAEDTAELAGYLS